MNRKRQTQIEQQAAGLLRSPDLLRYPVDVEAVAAAADIRLIPYAFGNDITTVCLEENRTIGVNDPFFRPSYRRFAIAHAIGHVSLGHRAFSNARIDFMENYFTILKRPVRNIDAKSGEVMQEREANAFAAGLLMPEKLIYLALDDLKDKIDIRDKDTDVALELAGLLGVSVQLLGFRLATLNTLW